MDTPGDAQQRRAGYHEAGHALIASHLGHPFDRVSIIEADGVYDRMLHATSIDDLFSEEEPCSGGHPRCAGEGRGGSHKGHSVNQAREHYR